jgi:hypothetical protein
MDYVRQAIDLAAAHPIGAVGCVAAAILYLNLMLSGPRTY